METPDSEAPDAGPLPVTTTSDRVAAATAPRRPTHRARRRERRQEAKRERYGPRDLAEDALDLTLDVLFFWR